MLYLVYIMGIFMGPLAGRLSNRFGSGRTLLGGAFLIAVSLGVLLLSSIAAVITGLLVLCAGFFTVHSAAVGALNRRLSSGQGRANALYVLFYYIGGWIGITCSGIVYKLSGWNAVVWLSALFLVVPIAAGIGELRAREIKAPSAGPQGVESKKYPDLKG
jgi:YNFM family putative membrane transporter